VVDVRYVALAIANGCITDKTLGKFAPREDLNKFLAFHKVTDFPSLVRDTDTRRKSLPALKANLQSLNLEELIKANGDLLTLTPERVNANIARRSTQGGFPADSKLGWMIDREDYNFNTAIALFRLYLQPLPANKDGV